jgi:hypothetical protein
LRFPAKSGNVLQLIDPPMKREAIISLALMAALAVVHGQDLPSQVLSQASSAEEIEEPALPGAEADPTNPGPGLLPKSGELPSRPSPETPAKSSSPRGPTQRALEKNGRFEVVRALAMVNRHAAYLLKRAKQSSNAATRRTYLRAYYMSVASRMRKLDPKLNSSINAYEESKLDELSRARTSTARNSTHRSRLRGTARLAGHHRLRRASYENRYRRIIVIDAPYGPDFPPYGPPELFEPW